MVHIRFAELWEAPHGAPYMIVITTNSCSNGYGRMVMGAGSASQAKDVYPELPAMAYKKIKSEFPAYRLDGRPTECYGFQEVIAPPFGIGIFQTKHHHQAVASLDAIKRSTEMLAEYAQQRPEVHIRMPFPGIGCGKYGWGTPPKEAEIKQVLSCLPDSITVVQWR